MKDGRTSTHMHTHTLTHMNKAGRERGERLQQPETSVRGAEGPGRSRLTPGRGGGLDGASKPGRHPPPPRSLAAAELLRGMGERESMGEGGRMGGRKRGGEGWREGEWKGGGDLLSELLKLTAR